MKSHGEQVIQLSIGHKILLAVLVNVFFMIAVGVYAVNQMNLIGSEIEEIANIDMPLVTDITNIEIHQLEQALLLERAIRIASEINANANVEAKTQLKQDFDIVSGKFHQYSQQIDRELLEVRKKTKKDIEVSPFEQDVKEFEHVLQVLTKIEQEHQDYEKHATQLLDVLLAGQLTYAQTQQSIAKMEHEEDQLDGEIEALLVEIEQFTAASLLSAEEHEKTAVKGVIIFVCGATFLGVIFSVFVTRLITRPIVQINTMTRLIAQGDISQKIKQPGSDEIGELAISVNLLLDTLNFAADQADAITRGDESINIQPSGDNDRFGHALLKMKEQIFQNKRALEQTNDDLRAQSQLKSQISAITELTQGASELHLLADSVIGALAEMTGAGHGVFYLTRQDGSSVVLELSGSYAFKQRKNVLPEIAIGEGLVGQCGKEKKTILLTQAPTDYIQINSGLGEQLPLNILLVPVLFEQTLIGVIELASFIAFSKGKQSLLELVSNNIGIVVNNLLSKQKTERLLRETQSQAEELQTQQEELKSANESLLDQTQRLKVSEEELKGQSEELKVSNEELSQKQSILEQQKEQVEASKRKLTVKADELAQASKYKSEFLANMSHELRTPLNSLLLLAKSLADNKKGNLNETQIEDAKIIHAGGITLLTLINDILDLSKVEAGKLNIHIETLQIDVLVSNLQKMFNPVADAKGLNFVIEIAEQTPKSLSTDAQRLEQVLRNLLSNAIKFTQKGTVTLKLAPASQHLDQIAFCVTDTGVGIPQDKLQAIFEAFQQQDGSTSRKFGGTGLGLTIARELTQLLGGQIQVNSVLSHGSTFTLLLPNGMVPTTTAVESTPLPGTIEALPCQLPQQAVEQYYPPFVSDDRLNIQAGDKTLLIIDDDAIFASILRDFAVDQGYKALVAGDGRSGIYLAQQYQPSGIILDIRLPDIDGHQVLEQLKFSLKTRHIPVEVISAHSENKTLTLQQGAIGLLVKPVNEQQLQAVLTRIADITDSTLKNVLIIEDDHGNQMATAQLLQDKGLTITCVDNGKDGCREILTDKYDCVVLDLGLPDMTGFAVLEQISAGKAHKIPPIIVYTGKEISDQEQAELEKYSSTIVIKGVGSAERLLDDISLFMHKIESKNQIGDEPTVVRLHDESAMLQGRRILLVDDDMRNTYALSKKLLEIGFDVEIASNGEAAVESMTCDSGFELVLMDIMMPVMDGLEAIKCIRQMAVYQKIPIIALTAKTMPEDREKCFEAGVSEYITKPIDFEKLLSVMRIWLFKHLEASAAND